jgi:hypothetical protein
VPFPLLAVLLVGLVVGVVFAIFSVARRWL